MKKFRLTPIAYGGWTFIFFFAIWGFAFLYLGPWFAKSVGAVSLLLAVFCISFFRDPDRKTPGTSDIFSPGDGKVTEVVTVDGEGYGRGTVIRIFLSVLDIHVQRSPVSGQVTSVQYVPGLFMDARDPRAAFVNECNVIEIASPQGRIFVKQIAGFIARRIECWVRAGDDLDAGERIGLIRFGSQVDLYVPREVKICVQEGDRVVGGLTVLGQWPGAQKIAAEGAKASAVPVS